VARICESLPAVTRILHLSDLHLGPPFEHQFLDRNKGELAAKDRRAERDVLGETLKAFKEEGGFEEIEAMVISGDLTNRAKSAEFDEFHTFITELAEDFDPAKIVVLPGNHDVPRDHGPSEAEERYAEFIRVTRGSNFVTPLLDGIDFKDDGSLNPEANEHPHVIAGSDFVIVPVNSSHFCWGTEPLPAELVERLLAVAETDADLAEAVKDLRRYDIPRVSNAQMRALRSYLEENGLGPAEGNWIRFGVLHHQLLPVSAREEYKSFEGLTNLGAVREFLVGLGTQVILHGHKHEAALFWDYLPDGQSLDPPDRTLISAAPAQFRAGLPVARIVEFDAVESAPEVRIEELVAAERIAGQIARQHRARALLWDSPAKAATATARVIKGETSSDVYARVQSVFAGIRGDAPLRYLICEIATPEGADVPPRDYAVDSDEAEVERWMRDLVEWWQHKEPQLSHGVTFNHGERIYTRWDDQVEKAAELLSASIPGDPLTTRASILLLDPTTEASPKSREFPSFVSIQLQLVPVGTTWRLDCTGFFRKQEMRYWWPINVAELAAIQAAVAEAITIEEQGHPLKGMLRTITAHAIVEDRLPAVAVPAIDRALDQRPEDLWRMANSLIDPERAGDKGELRRLWDQYLEDLRPDAHPGEVPSMSRRGLQMVLRFVDALGVEGDQGVTEALKALTGFYGYFEDASGANPNATGDGAAGMLDELDAKLDRLLGSLKREAEPG
jgi:3',5'-cyclic AMP phosphodiesterase CpdA